MKMNNYCVCCANCLADIAKRDTAAARLWMDLCVLGLQRGSLLAIRDDEQEHPFVRAALLLEQMGFILTTDQAEDIIVRLNGLTLTKQDEPVYCLKQCSHG